MIIAEHVSDVINKEEIKSWETGSRVFISAGTGMGKSHFAKNDLYNFAKESNQKILLVLQRKRTYEQFDKEIPNYKKGIISLYLYQWLEDFTDEQRDGMLSGYDYIVVDEAHYFLNDSSFNEDTDKSLDSILASRATVIFMTATSNKIKRFLEEIKKIKLKYYEFDTKKVIGRLQFYKDDDTLIETLNDILCTTERKAAVFCGSAKKALQLHKRYKEDSIFDCSDQNTRSSQRSVKEIDDMINNSRFDRKFLFATASLDTGFNLEDRQLNTIIIDNITDLDTLVQFVGRKRMITKHDTITVFVRIPSRRTISAHLMKLSSMTRHANQLMKLGGKAYECFFERDNDKSNVVYFDHITREYQIILPAYYGALWKKSELIKMKDDDGTKLTYARMVWEILAPQFAEQAQKTFTPDVIIPTLADKELADKLKKYEEEEKIFYTQKDKILLYESLNQRVNNRVVHSVKTINHLLECRYGLPYRLEQFSVAAVIEEEKESTEDSEEEKESTEDSEEEKESTEDLEEEKESTEDLEEEKIKVYSAIKVIDASNKISTDIEEYLRMCYTQGKIWYGASDWKAEGEIVDKLRFTDKNKRVFKTAAKINEELERRQSRYRIHSYVTTHKILDINNNEHRHTTTAWKIKEVRKNHK